MSASPSSEHHPFASQLFVVVLPTLPIDSNLTPFLVLDLKYKFEHALQQ
jgi:hypothetical protein